MTEQRACATDEALSEITRAINELSEARNFIDLVFYASDGTEDPRLAAVAAGCNRATLSLDEMAVYLDHAAELLKGGAQ